MITTNKFPSAIVSKLIAAMDDFMLFGAYIETFHNINYNIINKSNYKRIISYGLYKY